MAKIEFSSTSTIIYFSYDPFTTQAYVEIFRHNWNSFPINVDATFSGKILFTSDTTLERFAAGGALSQFRNEGDTTVATINLDGSAVFQKGITSGGYPVCRWIGVLGSAPVAGTSYMAGDICVYSGKIYYYTGSTWHVEY